MNLQTLLNPRTETRLSFQSQNGRDQKTAMTCLKLGTTAALSTVELELSKREEGRSLALTIAAHTVKVLKDDQILDKLALERSADYLKGLEEETASGCILEFLFPEEEKLWGVLRWLDKRERFHVWEVAHHLPVPSSLYKAHPEILAACQLCGAIVLDASTPATLTTGGLNPLAGPFLARWIQAELRHDLTETRPRFFAHVIVPPRQWASITRAHYRP